MTDPEAAFARANDCYKSDDLAGAVTAFRQALALSPDHVGALANLTIALPSLGRPLAVIRYARRAEPVHHAQSWRPHLPNLQRNERYTANGRTT